MKETARIITAFRSLPQSLQEATGGPDAFLVIDRLEKKFSVKLGLLVMQVAIGDLLMQDIESYLQQRFNLTAAKAQAINLELQKKIFTPALDVVLEDMEASVGDLDSEQQVALLRQLISKRTVEILANEDEEFINAINGIIRGLLQTTGVENQILPLLVKELETNSEVLLEFEDRPLTVGSLIADFRKWRSGIEFNDLDISRYLLRNPFPSECSKKEKRLIQRLLLVYSHMLAPADANGTFLPSLASGGLNANRKSKPSGTLSPIEKRLLEELQ
ncbi:MAG: hypothetical protein KBB55_00785 [Candidatus Buchananbacteria bacterium]|nr:hypothetical protein [Candidatus Buchananbacteria bacterium]